MGATLDRVSGTLGTAPGTTPGTTLGGRARQVADAAIAVLAGHGARGLTHRAVDQAAGLSPGTTSNYARTRVALLTLTLTRIAELDVAEGAARVAGPGLADDVAQMVHQWIIEPGRRQRFLARLELAFEATRRPELRAAYDEMGRGFRTEAARLLAAAGSAHPERDAWTLIAWVEGTAFYALAGAGGAAVPSLAELRAQATGLLASLCGGDAGAA
jgi:Tetracyclin repressor-like, C-terminal domain